MSGDQMHAPLGHRRQPVRRRLPCIGKYQLEVIGPRLWIGRLLLGDHVKRSERVARRHEERGSPVDPSTLGEDVEPGYGRELHRADGRSELTHRAAGSSPVYASVRASRTRSSAISSRA
jgi:hypothetical protein